MASSWSRKGTGSLVPHLRSRKVLVETKTTAAWNGDLPPNGMPNRLASSGMFWVASVWRPGPKVSSALPSRKKTACWLSSTMSWLPSRMAAVPLRGPAGHQGLPGLVLVLDHIHGLWDLRRFASGRRQTTLLITSSRRFHLSSRARARCATFSRAGSRTGAGSSAPGAGTAAISASSPLRSSSTERSNSYRRCSSASPILTGVEQAARPVVGKADRLRQAVELPVQAVERAERADLAGVRVAPRPVAQRRLQPPQLRREVLALELVYVPPQLAVLEAPETGDLVTQPLEDVPLPFRGVIACSSSPFLPGSASYQRGIRGGTPHRLPPGGWFGYSLVPEKSLRP